MSDSLNKSSLAVRANAVVADLTTPKPWIYWTDFLVSVTVAWTGLLVAYTGSFGAAGTLAAMGASIVALYRSVIFVHELAHLDPQSFRSFRFVWNLLCGVPFLVPSFTYTAVHNDHHKRKVYGTHEDGEYVGFATGRPSKIVAYVFLFPLLPWMQLARFALLTPLSYLHPALRRLLWRRASSLTIDLAYRRPEPSARDGKHWRLQEAAASAFAVTALTAMAAGVVSWRALGIWYVAASSVFLLNSLRTLAAHRYRNAGDRVMDATEQYLDSINVPGNAVTTPAWAPVGLRYHATHHLVQRLPYHSLGAAHRRLAAELPDKAVYLAANRRSLVHALKTLWADAAVGSARPVAAAEASAFGRSQ